MSRGRILVIRGGAIGDFLLTLPVLAALRKHFPQTLIDVLGYPHIAALAGLGGYVNDVRSIEARALAGFFARGGALDESLQNYFAQFNIIISYLYDPDEIFRKNVARGTKAQFIAGPHRPDEKEELHATEVFLKPLERLAIFGADPVPRLDIAARSENESRRQQDAGGTLAVHPGSGSEAKNWPEPKWAELLRTIACSSRCRVLLVGGEAEQERLQRLSSLVPVDRLELALNLPLTKLAERFATCDAFAGHDSGITHLAAAVGLRGLALWGDSNAQIWQPRGGSIELVRDEGGLRNLPAPVVFARLKGLF